MLSKTKVMYTGTKEWNVRQMPPAFTGKKAYVLPGAFYGQVVTLMAEAGFERGTSVKDSDVVVFIGGSDISPKLYGEKDKHCQGVDAARDTFEMQVYQDCLQMDKVMFGICRGAQFLHAMNNGKLWQHVNGHAGKSHLIIDIEEDVSVMATSIHHQMLKANTEITIVAVTNDQVATRFEDQDSSMTLTNVSKGHEIEIEAGAYDKTKCFFVQGHPEVGSHEYRTWTMHKLSDFMRDWTGGNVPIKEVIERMIG